MRGTSSRYGSFSDRPPLGPPDFRLIARWAVALAIVLFLMLFGFTGCAAREGYVQARSMEATLRGLVRRHERYTKADKTLSPLEKRVNLRDGELLIRLVEEAQETPSE